MLGQRRKTPRFFPVNRNFDIQNSLGLKGKDLAQHKLCSCQVCNSHLPDLSPIFKQSKTKLCGYPSFLQHLMIFISRNNNICFRKAGICFPTTCFFQEGKVKSVSQYVQGNLVFSAKSQSQVLKLLRKDCNHWIAVTKRGFLKRLICLQQLNFYLTPNSKTNPMTDLLYIQKYPNSHIMLDTTIGVLNKQRSLRSLPDKIQNKDQIIPFFQQFFLAHTKISIQNIQLIVTEDDRGDQKTFWIKECLLFETKALKKVGFKVQLDNEPHTQLQQILIRKMANFYQQTKIAKQVFTDFKFNNQDHDSNQCFRILYPAIQKSLSQHLNTTHLQALKANLARKKRIRSSFLTEKSVCKTIRTSVYRKHSLA